MGMNNSGDNENTAHTQQSIQIRKHLRVRYEDDEQRESFGCEQGFRPIVKNRLRAPVTSLWEKTKAFVAVALIG
jgi:hypothetical protein